MAASLRRGKVTLVAERHPGLVRLTVDGVACIAYPGLTGPVALGDEVVVNVQARELGLGSGGFDVVVVNLTRGLGLAPEPGAHVMTHPYSPLQAAVLHIEEGAAGGPTASAGPALPDGPAARPAPGPVEEAGAPPALLAGLPVVCCSLHAQLAPVCAGLGEGLRVAYAQLGGGALPVALSDTVRTLQARGLLEVAVAVAPCIAGDVQAVSVASALVWAAEQGFAAVVCGIGPGVVGTGSRFGHGGLAVAAAANTTAALGGRAVVAARVSAADARERHRGLSHHTRSALALCLGEALVAWPAGLPRPAALPGRATLREVVAAGWEAACAGLPLAHMGRGPAEDPDFFAAAYAAGRLARELVA